MARTGDIDRSQRVDFPRSATDDQLEQELLRALFDAMPQLGWTARPDGFTDYYNRGWYEYSGTTYEQMQGWGWTSIHHPDELPRVLASWERAIATGKPFEVEFPLRRRDGVYRWFLSRATPIYGKAGELIRWIGINTDIDDQKRAEKKLAELDEAKSSVDQERTLLKLFVDHAPAGIAMFDRDMRYVAVSHRWCTDFHLPADLVGRSHYELFPALPEAWKDAHRRSLAGETLSSDEDRFVRLDGLVVWTQWETRPWYRSDGTIGGIMIAAEDITSEVTARRAAEDARKEAERANRAKDEFLAMLGHELRNPLSPILTAVQLMRLRGGETSAGKLDVVERQVRHMMRLVDDLLDVSRIASGKITLQREAALVADVVTKAVEMASPAIEQGQHNLDIQVSPRDLVIVADSARLAQVISNLLTNAAKYTPRGGRIVIAARAEGDQVLLEVKDNGMGISRELLPRIFDLFSQGRQGLERSQGGLGLGLAIVRSLVELHGGHVVATSDGANRGSTFTIRIPTQGLPNQKAQEATTAPRSAAHGEKTVLIVDDNEDAARLLAETLEAAGYLTHVAFDGVQSLDIARAHRLDIAVLDLGLPVMDGYEVARRLREMLQDHAPSLIAVTGYGQDSDRRRTSEMGFNAHLVKPVDMAELLAVLREKCSANRSPLVNSDAKLV
jgi:PAS domain S-box-containing protein